MTSFEEQIKTATDNGIIPGVVLIATDATGILSRKDDVQVEA